MSPSNVVVTCAVGAVLIVIAITKRREISSPAWTLLRVLLPSWRFFEQVQPAPRLLCRFAGDDEAFGAWHELLRPRARCAGSLLLNARGNLRLACLSTLEHLQSELEAMPSNAEPTELVAYQLVRSIVLDELARRPDASAATRYQFCVAEAEQTAPGESSAHVLVSEVHLRAG